MSFKMIEDYLFLVAQASKVDINVGVDHELIYLNPREQTDKWEEVCFLTINDALKFVDGYSMCLSVNSIGEEL